MNKYLVVFSAVLLCLAFNGAPIAVAQEEEEEFTLEEITVTAQKREENQQKVAIAMEVITGEDLVAMGKNDIDEILRDIANVEINTASTGMRVSIRGIVDDSGTMDDQQLSGSMVSVNIDGSYNNMGTAGQGLFDVERVEVLMGPQSTMYGSNAPGGIVNVVTAAPKMDKYSANATVEYGSYDLLNLQGVLNVPVIQEILALRLAANSNKQGSWVEGDPAGKSTAVRLKALWNIYEDLELTVTGNWQERASGGMMGGQVKPFVKQDDDYYPDGTPLTDPWTPSSTTGTLSNRDNQVTKGINANIDWATPIGNLAIVPSYSKTTSEGWHSEMVKVGNPPPPGQPDDRPEVEQRYFQSRNNEQKGAEVRMTNAADFELFQWIVGGTWYESEQLSMKDYEDADAEDEGRETWGAKKALYANITYPVWFHDLLRLTLGYRQSWDENNSYQYGGFMEGLSGNPDTYSKPDLKYGFEYDAADNMMVYGTYSTSYRSGNSMAMRQADGDYPPNEELDAYTLGVKSRFLDNRLQVNVSAYYYDYSNKLCAGYKEGYVTEDELFGEDTISPSESGRNGYASETDGVFPSQDIYDYDEDGIYDEDLVFHITDRNAQGYGAFSSLGIDLSTTWVITRRDRLNLSIAYLNAEWETLFFDYEYDIFEDESFSGVTPANSPELAITASYQHNFTLGALGTLTPRIDMKYKSEFNTVGEWKSYIDPYGYGVQEAYTMWDASAAFQHSSGKWSLNAYVKNMADYAVKTQARVTDFRTEMRLGDPRTFGATFSIKF